MKAIAVTHVTESRKCDFDAFIERFESQLGTHDISAYRNRLGDSNAPGEVRGYIEEPGRKQRAHVVLQRRSIAGSIGQTAGPPDPTGSAA